MRLNRHDRSRARRNFRGRQYNAHERGRAVFLESERRRLIRGMSFDELLDAFASAYDQVVAAHISASEAKLVAMLDAFTEGHMRECDCEPTSDPLDPEDDGTQYARNCPVMSKPWWSLHCEHDGHQNPCPHCGGRHQADAE